MMKVRAEIIRNEPMTGLNILGYWPVGLSLLEDAFSPHLE